MISNLEKFLRSCRKCIVTGRDEVASYFSNFTFINNYSLEGEDFRRDPTRSFDYVTFEGRPWKIDNRLADNELMILTKKHIYYRFIYND